jgi:hypothetical protein
MPNRVNVNVWSVLGLERKLRLKRRLRRASSDRGSMVDRRGCGSHSALHIATNFGQSLSKIANIGALLAQDLVLQAQDHTLLLVIVFESTYAFTQPIGPTSGVKQPSQVLVNLTLPGLVFGLLLVISVGKLVQKERFNDAAGSLVIADAFNR